MATVNVRLESNSRADLDAAIKELADKHGSNFISGHPRAGRKGGYLAYCSLKLPDAPKRSTLDVLLDVYEETKRRREQEQEQ